MSKQSIIPKVDQHIEDKGIIDHLTSGPLKPDMAPRGEKDPHQFTEDSGRKLDKALHKEWTQDEGGLPEF
jgi:hypothetical protein